MPRFTLDDEAWATCPLLDAAALWRSGTRYALHVVPLFVLAHVLPLRWEDEPNRLVHAFATLMTWGAIPLAVLGLMVSATLAIRHRRARGLLAPWALWVVLMLILESTFTVLT